MPDVETAPAAPSPAAEAPTTPSKSEEPVSVPTNAEDYAEWRTTGKLPEKKSPSPKEASAPSKKTVTPDSEHGAQQKRRNADSRKEELNREIRDLIAKRDQAKQEVEAPAKKDVKPIAEPSTAQPVDPKRPVKPKAEDFKDWAAYETAKDKYDEDLADYKAEQKIQEYEQRQRQSAQTQALQVKLDEAKSRYGDEAEPKIMDTAKTVFDDKAIPIAIKTAIGRSKSNGRRPVCDGQRPERGSHRSSISRLKILSKLSPQMVHRRRPRNGRTRKKSARQAGTPQA